MHSADEGNGNGRARRWRLSRVISIPDIITIISAAVAVVLSHTNLDKRITLVEANLLLMQKMQQEYDRRQDEDLQRTNAEIKSALRDIMHKLDRIVEGRR